MGYAVANPSYEIGDRTALIQDRTLNYSQLGSSESSPLGRIWNSEFRKIEYCVVLILWSIIVVNNNIIVRL